jgi:tetratricopeptide (TPR) repeat protein
MFPTPAAGTPQELLQRGHDLIEKKDAPRAVAAFLAALRLKPNSPEASNGLGLAFRAGGNLEEAIAAYHMALRLDPKFGAVHRNLAQAFEEKGERLLAAQAYDRYLLLVPGAGDAAEVRAKIAQLRNGNP